MYEILLILLALNTSHVNANQHLTNILCPDGFRHWSSSCYRIESKDVRGRDGAQTSCSKMDSRMVEITSIEEDEFIRSLALAENKTLDYWIGMEDKVKNYYWMDETPLTYTYWDTNGNGAHNDQSDCIRMEADSQHHYWNDKSCAFKFWALCEGNETDPVCANVVTKFNSSCYYVSNETFPRDQAKIYCEEGGAHLVFIETPEENSFILKFVNEGEVYWIGLTRRLAGSDRAAFGWMSGEPLVYSNFGDLSFGSGCLQIQKADGYTEWNAAGCSQNRGYICERRDLAIVHGLQRHQRFILKQENSLPIQESVIDDVTTQTLIRCTSMCMLNRDCVSFGYNAQERICILANGSIGTTSAGDGFRHYVSY
eukprot:XP_011661154.1 PREDICTED: C-type mannose receptor 2-like [Strongylocentrotus purpuratus]